MNRPTSSADAAAFWQFSLMVYSRPQVAACCLGLQDEYGFDVNIVLLCLWLAQTRGRTVGRTEIEALRAGVADLNENLVRPIRLARRKARSIIETAPDPQAGAERRELYAALKAIELRGERLIQAALIECLGGGDTDGGTEAQAAARASLETYRKSIGAPDAAAAILAQLTIRALCRAEGQSGHIT
ncbi:TIGR02444 family protein [Acidocella sp.]|uniref:TIGR02444 family protein n=1 Tax=Acidocella sp. TaxID=50710 RepID=UPI00261F27A5|nr:TIGR02444 family protein [Acidocella sp.]MDD2795022.1 TIGR02444 family protein [Acidocella sp.]